MIQMATFVAATVLVAGLVSDAGISGSTAGGTVFPLSLSPNKSHLIDAKGAPFFLQGDTAWELVPSLNQADTVTYLSDRQSRGYNAIIVQVMEHEFTTHHPAWLDVYGNAPFTTGSGGALDFTKPNEVYFQNVDWVLKQASARGIAVLLFPAYLGYSCGNEGWCGTMGANGTAAMVVYGQYLGNRYKNQPNIIWVLGGDYTPSGDVLAEVSGIAKGIRAAGDTHLMTAHWGMEESAADLSPAPPWLQIDSLYTYKEQSLYQKAQSDGARDKGLRPDFLIEADYEGEHQNNPTTSETWRAQMYEPPLSGGMGFVFGNSPLWFFGTAGDGNAGWALATGNTGIFASWRTCLSSPGSQDGARAGAFLRSLPWQNLVSDSNGAVLTAGNGVVLARTLDGTLAVGYLATGGSAGINLGAFARKVTARWFDPSAGTYATIPGSPFGNTGNHAFSVPGKNAAGQRDWVLLLEAQ
jgi:hypothetical protein